MISRLAGKKGEMFENVTRSAASLIEICEDDLKMPIAQNKLAVVTSDDTLATKVAKRLWSAIRHNRRPETWESGT